MIQHKIIRPDSDALFKEAAKDLLRLIHQTLDTRDEFVIALAGGSTPKKFYQVISSEPYSTSIPWGKIRIYFTDERPVGPNSPDSNYGMANKYLFRNINIDPLHIHRIQGELDATEAAKQYHTQLATLLPHGEDYVPIFDLILLGVGNDGHVASLFPNTDILDVTDHYAAAVWVEAQKSWRISMTLPVINHASNVWMMVTGEGKQDIMDRIFNFGSVTDPLPVERLNPPSGLTWYLDAAAAKWLT